MSNLQHRNRLRPFRKLPHPAIHPSKPRQRDQEKNAAEHGSPEEGGEEIVEDEVLSYEWTLRSGGAGTRARRGGTGLGVHE